MEILILGRRQGKTRRACEWTYKRLGEGYHVLFLTVDPEMAISAFLSYCESAFKEEEGVPVTAGRDYMEVWGRRVTFVNPNDLVGLVATGGTKVVVDDAELPLTDWKKFAPDFVTASGWAGLARALLVSPVTGGTVNLADPPDDTGGDDHADVLTKEERELFALGVDAVKYSSSAPVAKDYFHAVELLMGARGVI